MFPPRRLICNVINASPIQIEAKTPEKTVVFCSAAAVNERSRLSNRQKMSGPLCILCVRICTELDGALHTTDPSHASPRSFPPGEQRLHPAIDLRCREALRPNCHLLLVLPLPIHLLFVTNHPASIWARVLGAFSPIRPEDPAKAYPILIHRLYL